MRNASLAVAVVLVFCACGSVEVPPVGARSHRAEILKDLGLAEGFDRRTAALKAREFVYVRNNPIPSSPSSYRGNDLYGAYTSLKDGSRYYCDGMANVYHFMLTELGIPARVVVIGDREYFETGNTLDTHTTVDVDLDGWVSMDPTFNVTYQCDGIDSSTVDLVSCHEQERAITWTYGDIVFSDRTLESYYLPLTELLYDYRYW